MAGVVWGSVGGALQTGFGIQQYLKGKKKAESLVRPTYEIPPEIEQNLSMAQRRAMEGLPAEQKKQYVENIQRTMGAGLSGMQERGLGVAGVTALAQQQQQSFNQLFGADVAARRAGEQDLASARGTMAEFKERRQQINEFQPYALDYQEAQSMMGRGREDFFGGIKQMGAAESEGADRFESASGMFGLG